MKIGFVTNIEHFLPFSSTSVAGLKGLVIVEV